MCDSAGIELDAHRPSAVTLKKRLTEALRRIDVFGRRQRRSRKQDR
jgi:hypothetical protein